VVTLSGGSRPDFGTFNRAALLHGEQEIELHQTLQPSGSATVQARIEGIYDKGKAAVVRVATTATDSTGNPMWTTRGGMFISGEGGWGGERGPSVDSSVPDRPADHLAGSDTRTDQALLYRLSGDRNPLHSDPRFAASAGFDKPILHGLCTFGMSGRVILHELCGGDVDRFGAMHGRFKSPTLPGERLDVHIWEDGDHYLFQTRVGDRVVLDAGVFRFRSA
jgi:acyl dehydratase